MTRTVKSKRKRQIRIDRRMSRKHETKTIGNFIAPESRTLHFKDGKRVCFNCEIRQILTGDLVGCPKFGWEITLELAKQQRLCRD